MSLTTMDKWTQPHDVTDAEIAFPGRTDHLMPDYADIPREFKDHYNPYAHKVSEWFFKGLNKATLKAKLGIDANKAFRHMRAIMGSWEPQHEHKEAGVAYLMSRWFDLV